MKLWNSKETCLIQSLLRCSKPFWNIVKSSWKILKIKCWKYLRNILFHTFFLIIIHRFFEISWCSLVLLHTISDVRSEIQSVHNVYAWVPYSCFQNSNRQLFLLPMGRLENIPECNYNQGNSKYLRTFLHHVMCRYSYFVCELQPKRRLSTSILPWCYL